jgi:hypothetical protein
LKVTVFSGSDCNKYDLAKRQLDITHEEVSLAEHPELVASSKPKSAQKRSPSPAPGLRSASAHSDGGSRRGNGSWCSMVVIVRQHFPRIRSFVETAFCRELRDPRPVSRGWLTDHRDAGGNRDCIRPREDCGAHCREWGQTLTHWRFRRRTLNR